MIHLRAVLLPLAAKLIHVGNCHWPDCFPYLWIQKIWQVYILNYVLNQGLANYGMLPVVNSILEHSHTQSFTFCPWLFLSYNGKADIVETEIAYPEGLTYLLSACTKQKGKKNV